MVQSSTLIEELVQTIEASCHVPKIIMNLGLLKTIKGISLLVICTPCTQFLFNFTIPLLNTLISFLPDSREKPVCVSLCFQASDCRHYTSPSPLLYQSRSHDGWLRKERGQNRFNYRCRRHKALGETPKINT